jgi:serine protease Do
VNRKPVRGVAEFNTAMSRAPKGRPVLLLVKRAKQTLFISLERS